MAAIRAGQTRVVGKRTPPRFFIGNTVQSIYLIVRKRAESGRKVSMSEWAKGLKVNHELADQEVLIISIEKSLA